MNTEESRDNNFVRIAHEKATQMVFPCFNQVDHHSIQMAMENYPTLAIFMSKFSCKAKMKWSRTGKKAQRKSILDDKDVSCLAAVNYFQEGTHTQVLWLATTLSKPPVKSIHVVWRKLGLATYLLCMLVKQHTGLNNNMDHSVLSLQASLKRGTTGHRYYMSLRFIPQSCDGDNGLSLTSPGF
jgi:hypothetical protein